jgi:hypothetical protein
MPHRLLIPMLLLLACQARGQTPVAEPDPISKRLIDAREAFVREMESADKELLDAINEALSDATSDGDFDRAKRLTATKEAFEKEFLLPTDGSLGRARSDYHRRFVDARLAVEAIFDDLVVELTRAGDLKRGDSLRAEKERWLGVVAKRKTTKTRYQPPVSGAIRWERNGHYYKALDTGKTPLGISFSSAKKQCEELGGYLACGETPDEIDFLKSMLTGGSWIGACKDKAGEWVWISGVPLDGVPRGDGKDFGFARIEAEGLLAIPEDGTRRVRTWAFICEWDE